MNSRMSGRNPNRSVPKIETLETRALLTGGFSAAINFQPARVPVPAGYLADSGQSFADRGNGYTYGWNGNDARFVHYIPRPKVAPDLRYDTFAVTTRAVGRRNPGRIWQIEVPNGQYTVDLVAGDGTVGWGLSQFLVNGTLAIDGRATVKQRWLENEITVTVDNNLLTIANGPKSPINKLAFVQINQVVVSAAPPLPPVPPAPPTPPPPPSGPAALGTLTWHRVSTLPIGYTEAMGETVNGKLYVFGGYTDTTYLPSNSVWRYDPSADTWTRLGNMPVGTTHTGTAVDGTFIYLAGGYPPNSTHTYQIFSTTNVWQYNTTSDTWAAMPALPQGRGAGQLANVNHVLYYISGADANRVDRHEVWSLDLNNLAAGWVSEAPIPTARNHLGVASLNGKLYAIGGAANQDAAETALSTNEVYDPSTNTWSEAAPMPTTRALMMAGCDTYDGYIIVAGGETAYNVPTNQVTAYDPTTNAWTQLTPLPIPRTSGILKDLNGELIYTTGHPGFNGDTFIGTFS
jgi:N-acetylneuraminic acid mutarotase